MGLTYPQYLVLFLLFEASPRNVGEIGTQLGMDNGTLTPLLKRLQAAGLITRDRDPTDERRVVIGLAPAGEALRGKISLIPAAINQQCQLSEQELAALQDTLNRMAIPRAPD